MSAPIQHQSSENVQGSKVNVASKDGKKRPDSKCITNPKLALDLRNCVCYQAIEKTLASRRATSKANNRNVKRPAGQNNQSPKASKVPPGKAAENDNVELPKITTSFLDETYHHLRGRFNRLRSQMSNCSTAESFCDHVEGCTGHDCDCPRGTEKITSTKIGGTNCDYVQETIIERSVMTDKGIQTTTKHVIKRCDKNGHIDVEVEESKQTSGQGGQVSSSDTAHLHTDAANAFPPLRLKSAEAHNPRFDKNASLNIPFECSLPQVSYGSRENRIGASLAQAPNVNRDSRIGGSGCRKLPNCPPYVYCQFRPRTMECSDDSNENSQDTSEGQPSQCLTRPARSSCSVPSHCIFDCCPCLCPFCTRYLVDKLCLPERLDQQTINSLVIRRPQDGRPTLDYFRVGEILQGRPYQPTDDQRTSQPSPTPPPRESTARREPVDVSRSKSASSVAKPRGSMPTESIDDYPRDSVRRRSRSRSTSHSKTLNDVVEPIYQPQKSSKPKRPSLKLVDKRKSDHFARMSRQRLSVSDASSQMMPTPEKRKRKKRESDAREKQMSTLSEESSFPEQVKREKRPRGQEAMRQKEPSAAKEDAYYAQGPQGGRSETRRRSKLRSSIQIRQTQGQDTEESMPAQRQQQPSQRQVQPGKGQVQPGQGRAQPGQGQGQSNQRVGSPTKYQQAQKPETIQARSDSFNEDLQQMLDEALSAQRQGPFKQQVGSPAQAQKPDIRQVPNSSFSQDDYIQQMQDQAVSGTAQYQQAQKPDIKQTPRSSFSQDVYNQPMQDQAISGPAQYQQAQRPDIRQTPRLSFSQNQQRMQGQAVSGPAQYQQALKPDTRPAPPSPLGQVGQMPQGPMPQSSLPQQPASPTQFPETLGQKSRQTQPDSSSQDNYSQQVIGVTHYPQPQAQQSTQPQQMISTTQYSQTQGPETRPAPTQYPQVQGQDTSYYSQQVVSPAQYPQAQEKGITKQQQTFPEQMGSPVQYAKSPAQPSVQAPRVLSQYQQQIGSVTQYPQTQEPALTQTPAAPTQYTAGPPMMQSQPSSYTQPMDSPSQYPQKQTLDIRQPLPAQPPSRGQLVLRPQSPYGEIDQRGSVIGQQRYSARTSYPSRARASSFRMDGSRQSFQAERRADDKSYFSEDARAKRTPLETTRGKPKSDSELDEEGYKSEPIMKDSTSRAGMPRRYGQMQPLSRPVGAPEQRPTPGMGRPQLHQTEDIGKEMPPASVRTAIKGICNCRCCDLSEGGRLIAEREITNFLPRGGAVTAEIVIPHPDDDYTEDEDGERGHEVIFTTSVRSLPRKEDGKETVFVNSQVQLRQKQRRISFEGDPIESRRAQPVTDLEKYEPTEDTEEYDKKIYDTKNSAGYAVAGARQNESNRPEYARADNRMQQIDARSQNYGAADNKGERRQVEPRRPEQVSAQDQHKLDAEKEMQPRRPSYGTTRTSQLRMARHFGSNTPRASDLQRKPERRHPSYDKVADKRREVESRKPRNAGSQDYGQNAAPTLPKTQQNYAPIVGDKPREPMKPEYPTEEQYSAYEDQEDANKMPAASRKSGDLRLPPSEDYRAYNDERENRREQQIYVPKDVSRPEQARRYEPEKHLYPHAEETVSLIIQKIRERCQCSCNLPERLLYAHAEEPDLEDFESSDEMRGPKQARRSDASVEDLRVNDGRKRFEQDNRGYAEAPVSRSDRDGRIETERSAYYQPKREARPEYYPEDARPTQPPRSSYSSPERQVAPLDYARDARPIERGRQVKPPGYVEVTSRSEDSRSTFSQQDSQSQPLGYAREARPLQRERPSFDERVPPTQDYDERVRPEGRERQAEPSDYAESARPIERGRSFVQSQRQRKPPSYAKDPPQSEFAQPDGNRRLETRPINGQKGDEKCPCICNFPERYGQTEGPRMQQYPPSNITRPDRAAYAQADRQTRPVGPQTRTVPTEYDDKSPQFEPGSESERSFIDQPEEGEETQSAKQAYAPAGKLPKPREYGDHQTEPTKSSFIEAEHPPDDSPEFAPEKSSYPQPDRRTALQSKKAPQKLAPKPVSEPDHSDQIQSEQLLESEPSSDELTSEADIEEKPQEYDSRMGEERRAGPGKVRPAIPPAKPAIHSEPEIDEPASPGGARKASSVKAKPAIPAEPEIEEQASPGGARKAGPVKAKQAVPAEPQVEPASPTESTTSSFIQPEQQEAISADKQLETQGSPRPQARQVQPAKSEKSTKPLKGPVKAKPAVPAEPQVDEPASPTESTTSSFIQPEQQEAISADKQLETQGPPRPQARQVQPAKSEKSTKPQDSTMTVTSKPDKKRRGELDKVYSPSKVVGDKEKPKRLEPKQQGSATSEAASEIEQAKSLQSAKSEKSTKSQDSTMTVISKPDKKRRGELDKVYSPSKVVGEKEKPKRLEPKQQGSATSVVVSEIEQATSLQSAKSEKTTKSQDSTMTLISKPDKKRRGELDKVDSPSKVAGEKQKPKRLEPKQQGSATTEAASEFEQETLRYDTPSAIEAAKKLQTISPTKKEPAIAVTIRASKSSKGTIDSLVEIKRSTPPAGARTAPRASKPAKRGPGKADGSTKPPLGFEAITLEKKPEAPKKKEARDFRKSMAVTKVQQQVYKDLGGYREYEYESQKGDKAAKPTKGGKPASAPADSKAIVAKTAARKTIRKIAVPKTTPPKEEERAPEEFEDLVEEVPKAEEETEGDAISVGEEKDHEVEGAHESEEEITDIEEDKWAKQPAEYETEDVVDRDTKADYKDMEGDESEEKTEKSKYATEPSDRATEDDHEEEDLQESEEEIPKTEDEGRGTATSKAEEELDEMGEYESEEEVPAKADKRGREEMPALQDFKYPTKSKATSESEVQSPSEQSIAIIKEPTRPKAAKKVVSESTTETEGHTLSSGAEEEVAKKVAPEKKVTRKSAPVAKPKPKVRACRKSGSGRRSSQFRNIPVILCYQPPRMPCYRPAPPICDPYAAPLPSETQCVCTMRIAPSSCNRPSTSQCCRRSRSQRRSCSHHKNG